MPSPSPKRGPWATLRTRLTLWNTAVVLLTMAAALAAVSIGMRSALVREADAVLRGEVDEVALALGEHDPDVAAVVDALRRKAVSHAGRGWFTQLLTEGGKTIWRSDLCPEEVASYPPTRQNLAENVVQVGEYRYLRRRIVGPAEPAFHVRIGMSTHALDRRVATLTNLILVVGGFLALLTPLAAWWLAGRATHPVADILRTAERLRPTRLGDRLGVQGTNDELDRLALTINRLLDEVAGYVERQQQFVADAAHELRGPLAAIRSSLEVAISQERSSDEYRGTLADVLDASRHLAALANALLTLAEAADDGRSLRREPVNLGALAGQSVAMFTGVAEERGIALETGRTSGIVVTGDAAQLRQVIGNLLDNALRFTPAGGRVVVDIEADGVTGAAVLTVADTGSGIDHGMPTGSSTGFTRPMHPALTRWRTAAAASGSPSARRSSSGTAGRSRSAAVRARAPRSRCGCPRRVRRRPGRRPTCRCPPWTEAVSSVTTRVTRAHVFP